MSELENLVNSAKSAESTDGGQGAAPAPIPSQQGGAFTQTAKTQTTGGGLSGLAPQMPKTPAPSFGGALAGQYRTLLNTAYDAARKRMKRGGDPTNPVNPFSDTKGLFAAMMEKPTAQNAQSANPQSGGMEVAQPSMSQGSTQAQTQNPQNPATKAQTQAQVPAQRPQVTVGRGLFGGDARTYERNGATVEIPKSVGEDEKSVGEFMDMMDAVGDAMDRAYEEE